MPMIAILSAVIVFYHIERSSSAAPGFLAVKTPALARHCSLDGGQGADSRVLEELSNAAVGDAEFRFQLRGHFHHQQGVSPGVEERLVRGDLRTFLEPLATLLRCDVPSR